MKNRCKSFQLLWTQEEDMAILGKCEECECFVVEDRK